MGKKTATNAFYYFFTELKAKQKHPISNERAVELASPLWNKMSAEARRPYEEKANIAKRNKVKETCTGESVMLVTQDRNDKREKEGRVKKDIENMVKLANSEGTLADMYFYVIHINDFFYHGVEDKYYPAEIALGKFNLRHGILKEDVYHSNIYPGCFPMGYKLTAQQKAQETHKLPTEFGNKNNIREVLEMLTHLNEDQAPLFVRENDLFVTDKMIRNMCDEYEMDNVFNIYPFDHLMFVMKNVVYGPDMIWSSPSIGSLILDKETYEMCEEIACKYHQTVERQAHCSKSKVIRWVYTVCDNCTHMLNIQLIPGQHVPSNADVSHVNMNNLASGVSTVQIKKDSGSKCSDKTATATKAYHNGMAARPTNVTSTAFDSDVASYHGFESTDSQAFEDEEEEWTVPKRTVRLRTADRNMAAMEESSAEATSSQSQRSQSQLLNTSELTYRSTYLPGRRPSDMSQAGFRGRGRGKFHKRAE